jgi:hypothetical protein
VCIYEDEFCGIEGFVVLGEGEGVGDEVFWKLAEGYLKAKISG